MSALVVLLLGASIGPIVLKHHDAFFFLDRDGKVIKTIRTVGAFSPVDLATTPDGETLVFTAVTSELSTPSLFRFGANDNAPVRLVSQPGYAAQPTVTNDGQWVIFVHHPGRDGGPPGDHTPRAYGQLWRVRIDGRGLEPITSSPGCKLKPDALTRNSVSYTHADCGVSATVERTGKPFLDAKESATTKLARQHETGLVAFLREYPGNYEVVVCGRPCRTVANLPRDAEAKELAWGWSNQLFVQLGSSVFRVAPDGGVSQFLDLSEDR